MRPRNGAARPILDAPGVPSRPVGDDGSNAPRETPTAAREATGGPDECAPLTDAARDVAACVPRRYTVVAFRVQRQAERHLRAMHLRWGVAEARAARAERRLREAAESLRCSTRRRTDPPCLACDHCSLRLEMLGWRWDLARGGWVDGAGEAYVPPPPDPTPRREQVPGAC